VRTRGRSPTPARAVGTREPLVLHRDVRRDLSSEGVPRIQDLLTDVNRSRGQGTSTGNRSKTPMTQLQPRSRARSWPEVQRSDPARRAPRRRGP